MKFVDPSIQNSGLNLDNNLLLGWQKTILKLARRPKHPDFPRMNLHERVKLIMAQELANVVKLWQVFTSERQNINRYLNDPKKQAVAYLLGFHVANMARVTMLMERAKTRHPLSEYLKANKLPTELYDFGCGTGAMSIALADFLFKQGVRTSELKVNLYDLRKAFVDTAAVGFAETFADEIKLRTEKNSVDIVFQNLKKINAKAKEKRLQIFALGYVWNELLRHRASQRFFKELLQQVVTLGQHAMVVVVDAANQNIARETMMLRDELVAGGWQALYPCPHSLACPMLERSRDWCYSEARWDLPPLQKRLDMKLEINHQVFSTGAYLLVSPAVAKDMRMGKPKPIVVGRPLKKDTQKKPKGELSYLLCSDQGLSKTPAKSLENLVLRGEEF